MKKQMPDALKKFSEKKHQINKNTNKNTDNTESLMSRYDLSNMEMIPIDKIEKAPEEWNRFSSHSKEKLAETILSIKKVGLLHNIIVWRRNGINTCLSGHNRLEAYEKLLDIEGDSKYMSIPALVKKDDEINENIAQQIIIDANLEQRDISTSEKSKAIVKKLSLLKENDDEKSIAEFTEKLESVLKIKDRQIRRYRKLAELSKEFLDLIDIGRLSIETGTHIARLNEDGQTALYNAVIDNREKFKLLKRKSKFIKEDFTDKDIEELLTEENKTKKSNINIELTNKDNQILKGKFVCTSGEEDIFKNILEEALKLYFEKYGSQDIQNYEINKPKEK